MSSRNSCSRKHPVSLVLQSHRTSWVFTVLLGILICNAPSICIPINRCYLVNTTIYYWYYVHPWHLLLYYPTNLPILPIQAQLPALTALWFQHTLSLSVLCRKALYIITPAHLAGALNTLLYCYFSAFHLMHVDIITPTHSSASLYYYSSIPISLTTLLLQCNPSLTMLPQNISRFTLLLLQCIPRLTMR